MEKNQNVFIQMQWNHAEHRISINLSDLKLDVCDCEFKRDCNSTSSLTEIQPQIEPILSKWAIWRCGIVPYELASNA